MVESMHLVPEDELGLHLAAYDNRGPFVDGYWGISRADAERWAPFIREEIGRGNNTRDGLKAACADAGMGEELLHRTFYGWGGLIKELGDRFPAFLDKALAENPMKGEYLIPTTTDELIREGKATVKVLESPDKWYGVTYKEDKPQVVAALQSMKDKGLYPDKLWK